HSHRPFHRGAPGPDPATRRRESHPDSRWGALLRGAWWLVVLRAQFLRPLPARCILRRQDLEGRQASRLPRPSASPSRNRYCCGRIRSSNSARQELSAQATVERCGLHSTRPRHSRLSGINGAFLHQTIGCATHLHRAPLHHQKPDGHTTNELGLTKTITWPKWWCKVLNATNPEGATTPAEMKNPR